MVTNEYIYFTTQIQANSRKRTMLILSGIGRTQTKTE
nr:MAG TPA: hypothetical protein [Caudoviricetes sp.]